MAHSVSRFENGDLIFVELSSGTACYDPTTNTSSYSLVGTITGGTGQFEGATGSVEDNGVVTPLVVDPKFRQFGSAIGQFTATIITP